MQATNVEIKARVESLDQTREFLQREDARYVGTDHQNDTYFNLPIHDPNGNHGNRPEGRLKLREGNVENNLIYYRRGDQDAPKQSDVYLYKTTNGMNLTSLLSAALGVKVVVKKKREIYFIDNVKFHLDQVEGLGTFVEIEAIDTDGSITVEYLHDQCAKYIQALKINEVDLISQSYSDLLVQMKSSD